MNSEDNKSLLMSGGGQHVRVSSRMPKPDGGRVLWDIVHEYQRNELKEAPHQRDTRAWGAKKRQKWIKRLWQAAESTAPQPLGTICTYSLADDINAVEYINDGLQRIHTTSEAVRRPQKYGLNDDAIRRICKEIIISTQPRIYASHADAAEDFCNVNDGTSLHPTEKHKPIIVYSNGWDKIWKPIVSEWSLDLGKALSSFCKSTGFRNQKLSSERSDHHILSIFMCKRPSNYGPGPELEKILRKCFEEDDPDQVKKHIRSMRDFASEVELAWRNLRPAPEMMQESLARWCLGVRALYHEETRPAFWQDFFTALFKRTNGKAQLLSNNKNTSWNLTKRLELFYSVCEELELPPPKKPERRKNKTLIKSGYHHDHKLPFSDFGEGETRPLPARLNLAKNARS